MKMGNKGGRGKRTKRWTRVQRELHRLGGDNAGTGWAHKQASHIHARRIKHASSVDKIGRKGWKR